jgi:hypothetical protein
LSPGQELSLGKELTFDVPVLNAIGVLNGRAIETVALSFDVPVLSAIGVLNGRAIETVVLSVLVPVLITISMNLNFVGFH